MKTYIAGQATWRDPEQEPPPSGIRMLLLNPGGVCVIGTWTSRFIAWAPLPKIPETIKAKLLEKLDENMGKHP